MDIDDLISLGIINVHTIESELEGTPEEKLASMMKLLKAQERKIRAFELAIGTLGVINRTLVHGYLSRIASDALMDITIDTYKEYKEEEGPRPKRTKRIKKLIAYKPEPMFKNNTVL